jgi:hypothetical protein
MDILKNVVIGMIGVIYVALGFIVLLKNKKNKEQKVFFVFLFGIGVWMLSCMTALLAPVTNILKVLAGAIGESCSFLFVVAFYHLILLLRAKANVFTSSYKRHTSIIIGYILVLIVFAINAQNFFIVVDGMDNMLAQSSLSPIAFIFKKIATFAQVAYTIWVSIILFRIYKNISFDVANEKRLKPLLVASFYIYTLHVIFYILYETKFIAMSWLTALPFVLFVLIVFYLVIKDQLFDIDINVSAAINCIVSVIFIFTVFYLYNQHKSWEYAFGAIAVYGGVLWLIPRLIHFIQYIVFDTEDVVWRNRLTSVCFDAQTSIDLYRQALMRLFLVVKPKHASFFVLDKLNNEYKSVCSVGDSDVMQIYAEQPIGCDAPIVNYFFTERKPILKNDFELKLNDEYNSNACAIFYSMCLPGAGVDVAVPVFISRSLEAILMIGPKRNGTVYTKLEVQTINRFIKLFAACLRTVLSLEMVLKEVRRVTLAIRNNIEQDVRPVYERMKNMDETDEECLLGIENVMVELDTMKRIANGYANIELVKSWLDETEKKQDFNIKNKLYAIAGSEQKKHYEKYIANIKKKKKNKLVHTNNTKH